ncbi:MAG: FAD-dependent oxidoreductase [Microthrixaceae bacterium]
MRARPGVLSPRGGDHDRGGLRPHPPAGRSSGGRGGGGVLTREGVNLLTGRSVDRIGQTASGVEVRAGDSAVEAERVLLAVGRAAPADPGYTALGVEVNQSGFPIVDAHLRTTAPHVHAVGDVALRSRFTHMAAQSAMNAVTDQLVPFVAPTIDQDEAPWCTFTEPAVGHIGLTPAAAEARGMRLTCHEVELSLVDRAVINGDTEGFVRLYTRRGSSRIVGATVVSRDAGEMISQLALARSAGVGLLALAE